MENPATVKSFFDNREGRMTSRDSSAFFNFEYDPDEKGDADVFFPKFRQLRDDSPFLCGCCKGPLYITGGPRQGKVYYFKHVRQPKGDCPYSDKGQRLSPERILQIKFNGEKENEDHKELKSIISDAFINKYGEEQVYVERKVDIISANWRRPDVRVAISASQNIVFEIQLSTLFVSVITERTRDYHSQGWPIVWIFNTFEENEYCLSQLDMAIVNNSNIFLLDQEAIEKTKITGELWLNVIYRDYEIENDRVKGIWSKPQLVRFAELSVNDDLTITYFDSKARKKLLQEELDRQKKESEKQALRESTIQEIGQHAESMMYKDSDSLQFAKRINSVLRDFPELIEEVTSVVLLRKNIIGVILSQKNGVTSEEYRRLIETKAIKKAKSLIQCINLLYDRSEIMANDGLFEFVDSLWKSYTDFKGSSIPYNSTELGEGLKLSDYPDLSRISEYSLEPLIFLPSFNFDAEGITVLGNRFFNPQSDVHYTLDEYSERLHCLHTIIAHRLQEQVTEITEEYKIQRSYIHNVKLFDCLLSFKYGIVVGSKYSNIAEVAEWLKNKHPEWIALFLHYVVKYGWNLSSKKETHDAKFQKFKKIMDDSNCASINQWLYKTAELILAMDLNSYFSYLKDKL